MLPCLMFSAYPFTELPGFPSRRCRTDLEADVATTDMLEDVQLSALYRSTAIDKHDKRFSQPTQSSLRCWLATAAHDP